MTAETERSRLLKETQQSISEFKKEYEARPEPTKPKPKTTLRSVVEKIGKFLYPPKPKKKKKITLPSGVKSVADIKLISETLGNK